MTLEKRIQQSAAELGNLLRQAEKKHRRFLKRRDAKMQSISPQTPWTPDGHPLVFIVYDRQKPSPAPKESSQSVFCSSSEHPLKSSNCEDIQGTLRSSLQALKGDQARLSRLRYQILRDTHALITMINENSCASQTPIDTVSGNSK